VVFSTNQTDRHNVTGAKVLLTGLNPPHLLVKTGSGFLWAYVVGFFVFNDWRGEVIIRFVDIVEFYHRLSFFFIKV
jgi:hypothetical protein